MKIPPKNFKMTCNVKLDNIKIIFKFGNTKLDIMKLIFK